MSREDEQAFQHRRLEKAAALRSMMTQLRFPRYPPTMRNGRLSFGVLCAGLLAAFAVLAQQPAKTVSVTIGVVDPTGAGIPHARVRLVPSPENVREKPETDGKGRLSLDLKPGGYAVFVSAQGFRNVTQHIEIGGVQAGLGPVIPIVLQVKLGGGVTVTEGREALVISADPYHTPLIFSPVEFRALPHVTVPVHNGHTNAAESYSGVPLASLLEKVNAPLGKELRGEAMTGYLVAAGSDGYAVVLSLAEVDPEFHESQALVADSRDGQPLGNNGPFQLIVPGDKRPARWVHNLDAITLQHAP